MRRLRWNGGAAGFVSGPQDVKIVRTPARSARVQQPSWQDVVRRKEKREVRGGETIGRFFLSSGTFSPNARARSALPARLDTERFPCFKTGTPQAASATQCP